MTILMEHWLISSEDLRLLLSTLIVRYKCCGNVVVFLAFSYVALALEVVALALALGVVALLTSLHINISTITLLLFITVTYHAMQTCRQTQSRAPICSDVNKDLTFKAKPKDLTFKAKPRTYVARQQDWSLCFYIALF